LLPKIRRRKWNWKWIEKDIKIRLSYNTAFLRYHSVKTVANLLKCEEEIDVGETKQMMKKERVFWKKLISIKIYFSIVHTKFNMILSHSEKIQCNLKSRWKNSMRSGEYLTFEAFHNLLHYNTSSLLLKNNTEIFEMFQDRFHFKFHKYWCIKRKLVRIMAITSLMKLIQKHEHGQHHFIKICWK
jgi:hypothetical protein